MTPRWQTCTVQALQCDDGRVALIATDDELRTLRFALIWFLAHLELERTERNHPQCSRNSHLNSASKSTLLGS